MKKVLLHWYRLTCSFEKEFRVRYNENEVSIPMCYINAIEYALIFDGKVEKI